MDNNISDFLKKKVSLFEHLSENKLAEILQGSRVVSYESNEAVVRFGEDADFLGVLLKGKLSASVMADQGQRTTIGHLEQGATFGEMALMSGNKTMADLIAETNCQVLRIPVELFQSVIMTEPNAIQQLSKNVGERFKQMMADPEKTAAAFRKSADPYGLQLKGERPEKILVINCGSSSLKYAFFDSENESNTVRGQVERIGIAGTRLIHKGRTNEVKRDLTGGGFEEALKAMLEELTVKDNGVIRDPSEITVVGHRVVHGGEKFSEAVVIDDEILGHIEALNHLAPLHNPVNVTGIKEAQRIFSTVPHVAVFDTAFHSTLPSYAYLYGLPYEYYEKKGVRRYGFHGSSHSYVCLKAAQHLQKRVNELKIVNCHLGNGASLCAIDHGRSIDTSMGFTPGEGLIMGTRCGDLDPGVITYLEREANLKGEQIDQLLNKQSGLLGLSGISGDMREVEKAANNGDIRALVALKAFTYRVRKYIGAYLAAMSGMDVLIFTGGIGQGSAGVRSLALQGLQCMGIHLDDQRNREADGSSEICRISTDDSPITILIVPTDEERMIARETLRSLSRSYLKQIVKTRQKEQFLIEVSAHHIHLAQEDVEALFGKGHQLTKKSDLSQPGQFACEEQLNIIGPKGTIGRVRVLGPTRKETQVEISMTEQFKLGIHPPIRESGDLQDTPGCILEGTVGKVELKRGVICALRHIHMTPADALRYGLKDKSTVHVRVQGDRELVFGDVLIRVNPNYSLAMHIDTDEANAAHLQTGAQGFIEGIQNQS
ncbi:MAG: acetate/propionate family kinase [Bacteroidetes bacterium]|nr:MAG: acetate/propionate family kinase [Bacteroidota bacterium]